MAALTHARSPLRQRPIFALVVGGIGMRRLRQGKGQGLLKAALVIAIVILAAALVAVWAMAGKPN